jgi:hypothetical protein
MATTASLPEIGWVLFCLIALIWVYRGLVKWRREDAWRRAQGLNGRLEIFHRGKIRLYALGLTKIVLYLALGVQALFLPPRQVVTLTHAQRTLARFINLDAPLIITANVILLALMLILDDRDRTLLDRMEDERDAARDSARDLTRDPTRDTLRDTEHDRENGGSHQ